MAVFFALLTLFGWGFTDLFGALSSRKIGHVNAFFWMMVFSFILASFYLPFAGPINNWGLFLTAVVLNVLLLLVDIKYFHALEIGKASLVAAIAGSFGLVSAVVSVIFFHEILNGQQAIGILFATLGVILSSIDFKVIRNKNWEKLLPHESIKYALLALFGWGVYYAIVRIPIDSIGWFWTQYSWHGLFILLIILGKVKLESIKALRNIKQLIYVTLFALCMVIGVFSYNLGLTFGYTSIVAPIAATSTVFFVILSRFIFKEPLTKQQKMGIASSILGILLLAFASR